VQQGSIPVSEVAPILSRIYAFDHFIYNIDRHLGNFFVRRSRSSIAVLTVDYSKAWTYRGFPFPALPFDLRDPEHRTVNAQRDLTKMWGKWLRLAGLSATRLTNAFPKSAFAHYDMLCLYVVFHNFIRDHKTLRMAPAVSIGLRQSAMTVGDIVDLMDARAEPPKKRGPYKPRQPKAAA
jgi:hypothetical protein